MNEVQDRRDDALASKTRQAFDASVDALDGATRSRLAQARAAAVEAAGSARRPGLNIGGFQIAGLAVAAALAIAVVWLPQQPVGTEASLTAFDDLDILLDEEELELFEELEFYAWLDAQAAADDADADGAG